MEQRIKVIGIGANGLESLPSLYLTWIRESEMLIGGERQLSYFPDYQGEKLSVKGNLRMIVDRLKSENKKTVILASGDPMFYGIGAYLAKKLDVEVYPYLSSVQLAFAKMGESWQDCYFASVHGRSMKGLAQRIDGKSKVAILTDEENSPNRIAEYLLYYGMSEYRAFVAENLQGENEKTGWYELEEMVDLEFTPLNVVILKKVNEGPTWPMGIDDEEFSQRKPDKGLITKKEIRVLTLNSMRIQKTSTVWDVGTCTGSVAIEAAKLAPEGQVFAIEKNEADLENCFQNQRKFRADITAIHGKAPQGLENFPDPDAIFIGGTGGEMEELIRTCCERLKPGGVIVLNAVTMENLYRAVESFKKAVFEVSIMHLQISKSKPILNMTRFVPLNPIYMITAERKEDKNE